MEKIELIKKDAENAINECKSSNDLQQLKVSLLGKKGSIQGLMSLMKDLSKEEKPVFGQKVNELKQNISSLLEKPIATNQRFC